MRPVFIVFVLLTIAVSAFAQERTEKRETNPFTQISLRINADLYYIEGKEHSIEISGDSPTINKVLVEVSGQKLIVRFSLEDQWLGGFSNPKLKIKVTSPSVSAFFIQGSGNIIAEKPIETHFFEMNIAGSGNIKMNKLNCDRIECTVSGSGDVMIDEQSAGKDLKVNIAGSGDFKAPLLKVDSAYILIAGSGDCDLSVSNYLDAKIFGSGDIRYRGAPQLNSTITGSGKVHQTN